MFAPPSRPPAFADDHTSLARGDGGASSAQRQSAAVAHSEASQGNARPGHAAPQGGAGATASTQGRLGKAEEAIRRTRKAS